MDELAFIQRRLQIWYFGAAVFIAVRCFAELARRAIIGPWW